MTGIYVMRAIALLRMVTSARGRLLDPVAAPSAGERVHEVARIRNLVLEQILTGEIEGPADYLQEQDEWVVVLAGAAVLQVDGELLELHQWDWVLLPARTPHRLVTAEAGTSWLAVHLHPA